nr:MAG TPA: hypothetical protein [Caudoviricetes sp.]
MPSGDTFASMSSISSSDMLAGCLLSQRRSMMYFDSER